MHAKSHRNLFDFRNLIIVSWVLYVKKDDAFNIIPFLLINGKGEVTLAI